MSSLSGPVSLPMLRSLAGAWLLLAIALTKSLAAAEPVDFQRQIRPLLAEKCFACHGGDEAHREGGLRVDQREAALKGGDSGEPAIVPNQPDKSELIRRGLVEDVITKYESRKDGKNGGRSEKE